MMVVVRSQNRLASRKRRISVPVFRWRFDSPNVARLIQSQSENTECCGISRPDTVHHPCSDAAFPMKTFQANARSDFQRFVEAHCTSARVYQNYQAGPGQRMN
jgi:hypothetical protein